MSVKYSAGPNLSAIEASGMANNVNATTPIVPAMNDPIADTASAAPARPFLPSRNRRSRSLPRQLRQGVRIRIEVVDPPYFVP